MLYKCKKKAILFTCQSKLKNEQINVPIIKYQRMNHNININDVKVPKLAASPGLIFK